MDIDIVMDKDNIQHALSIAAIIFVAVRMSNWVGRAWIVNNDKKCETESVAKLLFEDFVNECKTPIISQLKVDFDYSTGTVDLSYVLDGKNYIVNDDYQPMEVL